MLLAFILALEGCSSEQKPEKKAKGESKTLKEKRSLDILTPVIDGDLDAIRKAVESGTDVNGVNELGYTPLMLAATGRCSNCEAVIPLLVELGADLEFKYQGQRRFTHKGMTALMLAVSNGRWRQTEIFLEQGANVNASDDMGDSALHWATGYCNIQIDGVFESIRPKEYCSKIVKILISNGAFLDATNKVNRTALELASTNANLVSVNELIAANATVTPASLTGARAKEFEHNSLESNYTYIISALRKAYARQVQEAGSN